MKRMMVVILALMALFWVMPVAAQDLPGHPDQVLVIDDTAMTVFGAIGLGVLVIVAALLVLLRDNTAKLANSAPPWLEPTLMTFAGMLDGLVKSTPTTVDDDLVKIIQTEIAKVFSERDKVMVQTVPSVDPAPTGS